MSKNNHNSKAGSNIERSNERISATSEVFTPVELICVLLDQIPEEVLKNPESKFLDNSAGCGNFFLALKDILLQYHSEEHIKHDCDEIPRVSCRAQRSDPVFHAVQRIPLVLSKSLITSKHVVQNNCNRSVWQVRSERGRCV